MREGASGHRTEQQLLGHSRGVPSAKLETKELGRTASALDTYTTGRAAGRSDDTYTTGRAAGRSEDTYTTGRAAGRSEDRSSEVHEASSRRAKEEGSNHGSALFMDHTAKVVSAMASTSESAKLHSDAGNDVDSTDSSEWACPSCTLKNVCEATECVACRYHQPALARASLRLAAELQQTWGVSGGGWRSLADGNASGGATGNAKAVSDGTSRLSDARTLSGQLDASSERAGVMLRARAEGDEEPGLGSFVKFNQHSVPQRADIRRHFKKIRRF